MKQVVIIDDENRSRSDLKNLIRDHCPNLEVIGEADGVQAGENLIHHTNPDAIFLDIAMQDGTGFDLLDRFDHFPFQVIFQTAFNEFALRAFKYNAIDYLLKPIFIGELKKAAKKITATKENTFSTEQLTNLLQLAQHKVPERITLSSNEGLHFVELSDIIRLQAEGNYTTFFLHSGEQIVVSKIIKHFEELLPPDSFFRTHQSHLVHLKYVKKVLREDGGYVMMNDGVNVPISRNKKVPFITLLKTRSASI